MATASVTKLPEISPRVVDGTAHNSAMLLCYRAISLMEVVSAAQYSDFPPDKGSVANVADAAAEMMRQVVQTLDEAHLAQGA